MISHTASEKKEIFLCGKNIAVAGKKKIKGLVIFLLKDYFWKPAVWNVKRGLYKYYNVKSLVCIEGKHFHTTVWVTRHTSSMHSVTERFLILH